MVEVVTPNTHTKHLRFRLPEGMRHVMLRRGHPSPAASAPQRSLRLGTWAPAFAINFVHAGRGTYVDDRGREHRIGPGSVFFRFPDRPHETRIEAADYDESWLVLQRPEYLHLRSLAVVDTQRPVVPMPAAAALQVHLDALDALPAVPEDNGGPGWVQCLHHVLGICALLRRDPDPADFAPPWIAKAQRLLSSNLTRQLSVAEVAARLKVGEQRFRKVFKAHVGQAPMEYRIGIRVDRARNELMLAGVAEVARTLGFGDPKHFSRQFRRYTGMSPRAFQRLGRERIARGERAAYFE